MTQGRVLWITGLPSSGKTSVAAGLHQAIRRRGDGVLWLDSDDLREVMTPQPTYEPDERDRIYRTLGRVAIRAAEGGVDVLVSATAPRRWHRDQVRSRIERFVELWLTCSDDELRRRDHRGLYAAYDAGLARNVPGRDTSFEEPKAAELTLDSERLPPEELVDRTLRWLRSH